MSTDETQGQEAPERLTNESEEEDTEGHVRIAMAGDAEGGQAPSVRTSVRTSDRAEEEDTEGHVRTAVRTSDRDEQDDTEGHVRIAMSGDPDFAARELGVRTAARDEDDTEAGGN